MWDSSQQWQNIHQQEHQRHPFNISRRCHLSHLFISCHWTENTKRGTALVRFTSFPLQVLSNVLRLNDWSPVAGPGYCYDGMEQHMSAGEYQYLVPVNISIWYR